MQKRLAVTTSESAFFRSSSRAVSNLKNQIPQLRTGMNLPCFGMDLPCCGLQPQKIWICPAAVYNLKKFCAENNCPLQVELDASGVMASSNDEQTTQTKKLPHDVQQLL